MAIWIARCQYCGKTGNTGTNSKQGAKPAGTPMVAGKCPSHPSGKKDANHAPSWEER